MNKIKKMKDKKTKIKMNDDEAKRKLKEWIDGLSPEIIKNLEITLSAVIFCDEVYSVDSLNLSNAPITAFKFPQRGVDEEIALALLEKIMYRIGYDKMAIENGRITLVPDTVELLKYAQFVVNKEINAKKTTSKKAVIIPIKTVLLSSQNYFLEINNGEKTISFKSRKEDEALGKETKQFKVLHCLWELRQEITKNNKITIKGHPLSLKELAQTSGCKSEGAVYKHIIRLNDRFKMEGVAIEIKGENGNYRLIVNKA